MMTEDFKFEEYLNFSVVILRVFFYWPPKSASRKWTIKFLYTVYSICMVTFMVLCFNLCEIANMISAIGDFDRMTQASFLLITNTTQALKLTTLLCNLTQIKQIIEITADDVFKPQSPEHHFILKRTMRNYKIEAILYFFLGFNCCFLWMMLPLIEGNGRQLPFAAGYPFDTTTSPRFEFTYAYQIISIFIHATISVATDNTCYGFLAFACAQLDVLNDALENLDRIARERIGTSIEEISSEMNRLLIESVNRHRAILGFLAKVIKTYTFVVVSQFVFGSAIVCISMYQLAQATIGTAEFWSCLWYLLCMMSQLFLYCWHGNEVMTKSEDLFRSAYMCDWVGSSVAFQRNLLTFMTRLSRPIQVNVAFFFTLSVDTFMAIIRCSWSYFAVLQSVEEK